MKQPLYAPLPYEIVHKGKKYKLQPSFDRVLAALDIFQRQDLLDEDKLWYAQRSLIKGRSCLDPGLLNTVFDLLIETNHCKVEGQKAFDFIQDSHYIFSAFYQTYGLDLNRERGRLHWWKFLALFNGLPDDTRILQIMQIRLRPMPEPNAHNQDEIRQLAKLKNQYRLEISEEERNKQFKRGLNKFARSLLAISEQKGGET